MKVIFLPLLWFLSGLGCGVVGYRWAGGDADDLRLERMKTELAKQQAVVAKQVEGTTRAAAAEKGQAASAAPVKPPAPVTTATFLEKSKELTQISRQLMETRQKSGKGLSREELAARLQQDIAAVLQTMNLPQDKIQQVQQIVARRDKAVQDTFGAVAGGAMDAGDSIFNRYMLKEKAREELRTVLGEEEAQQFERWEDSKTDRSTLEMMVKKGLKLDAAAEQVLIAALYESRLKFKDATTIPTYGAFAGVYSEEVKRRLTGALTPTEIQQVEAILKNLFPKKPAK